MNREQLVTRMNLAEQQMEHAIVNLNERCEAYKGQVKAGSAEIERLREAIEYAHSEGFEWPSDPLPPSSVKGDSQDG